MTKVITRSEHFIEIDGVEYEVRLAPDRHADVEHRKLDDGRMVLGYLIQDEDCENPLENCDGMGNIIQHNSQADADETSEALSNNPMIVPLSKFEHGSVIWGVMGSLSGTPDFRWDGTMFAGRWEPDKECENHIRIKAAESLLVKVKVIETAVCSIDPKHHRDWKLSVVVGKREKSVLVTNDWEKASLAASAIAKDRTSKAKWMSAIRNAARECAKQACESFTSWCNGDCHGVIVVTCNADGSMIDSDECWGYIGSEYAEQTVKEQMAAVK